MAGPADYFLGAGQAGMQLANAIGPEMRKQAEQASPLPDNINDLYNDFLNGTHPGESARRRLSLRQDASNGIAPEDSAGAAAWAGAAQGTPPPPPLQSFKKGDLPYLKELGDMRTSQIGAEQRAESSRVLAQTQRDVAGLKTKVAAEEGEKDRVSREKIAADNQKQKERDSQRRHKAAMASAEMRLEAARMHIRSLETRAKSSKDSATLKAIIDYKAKLEGTKARLNASKNQMGGALGSVPDLDEQVDALDADLDALDDAIREGTGMAKERLKSMRTGGGDSTEVTTKVTEKTQAGGDVQPAKVRVINENGAAGRVAADKVDAWLKENPKRKRAQ